MNTKQKGPVSPPASITMRDVYYVLFRHKWLITILAALGLVSSLGVYWLGPFPYISRAKVFIRYIQDARPTSDIDSAAKVQSPDSRGANIMNTELEILTSMDLAILAASNVGPAKILGKGDNNVYSAAGVIEANLKAEVPKDSDVIILEFKAGDPAVTQAVLTELIKAYRDKYMEIHLTPGFTDDSLEKQTDIARGSLGKSMQALEDEKVKMGITSLDDAKRNEADLQAKTVESIYLVEAELAQAGATIHDLGERVPGAATNGPATNRSVDLALAAPPPSQEVLTKYAELKENYRVSRDKETALLSQFTTDSNPVMQNAKRQRESAEKNLKAFEDENPGLLAVKSGDLNRPGYLSAQTVDPLEALREAYSKQHVLLAKYAQLTNQLAEVLTNAARLDAGEDRITKAQTEMKVADAKYEHFMLAKEQASINEAIDNKVSNISTAEAPTAPGRDNKQILKVTMGILGFFLVLAFGLPFLIEMVLDQSLKSPMDVQAKIGMPFFINIPSTNGHSKLAKLKRANQAPLLNAPSNATPDSGAGDQTFPATDSGQVAAWDGRHELRPFFETLRDRLMTYFEMINLTHKPKLVAVTSCGPGAGVTTTAAGLASSLSEIGEGNVLLVSMNVRDGEAHHFYKGKLTCGIEDVLEKKNREQAQVQNNLFVAAEREGDDRLPRVLPKRFSHLVPMMKASDYDYIIFDMPPVSEISITPRLARFMDMVLLVIESEKTSRDAAARVASLLAESKTNVGLVLNKTRSYMPKRLEQTF
jgi:Mrp family chromosome partitioning ATPase/uncharacterized protein involved in exopolysaccharide biosynthesis